MSRGPWFNRGLREHEIHCFRIDGLYQVRSKYQCDVIDFIKMFQYELWCVRRTTFLFRGGSKRYKSLDERLSGDNAGSELAEAMERLDQMQKQLSARRGVAEMSKASRAIKAGKDLLPKLARKVK